MFRSSALVSLVLASAALAQTYSATYLPSTAPKTSESGQSGTNQCGSGNSQTSMCQNVYVNSLDDWCIFAPPQPGAGSTIGETERIEVAWCIQGGHGTRVIPDGAITGAHFVQTPDYVQVTGVGDLTKINIPSGDEGGELDPHGADGNGNPIGGLVFSNAFGSYAQMHEWTNFVAFDSFCIRACKDGPGAPALCEHIYDVMGCYWNMPGDYSSGSFDSCHGDSGEPMGVYGTSTWYQGVSPTPSAHPAPAKSDCQKASTIGNGLTVSTPPAQSTSSSVSVSASPSQSTSVSVSASTTGSASSTPSSGAASTSGSGSASGSGSGSGSASSAPSTTASSTPGALVTSVTSAPSAPTFTTGASTTSAPTGAAGNGAASLSGRGRGLELMVAGAAVLIGAVVVA